MSDRLPWKGRLAAGFGFDHRLKLGGDLADLQWRLRGGFCEPLSAVQCPELSCRRGAIGK